MYFTFFPGWFLLNDVEVIGVIYVYNLHQVMAQSLYNIIVTWDVFGKPTTKISMALSSGRTLKQQKP